MFLSDNHVVDKVRCGDVEAYAELVHLHQRPIVNLMYRFCRSQGGAGELTQEVFCKAYEKLAGFGENRNFFPWLYTLAMNHGRDWVRRQQKTREGLRHYADSIDSAVCSPFTEKLETKQEIYRFGKHSFRAVEYLNNLNDFTFRTYQLGNRKVILNQSALFSMLPTDEANNEVEILARGLQSDPVLRIDIVFYTTMAPRALEPRPLN